MYSNWYWEPSVDVTGAGGCWPGITAQVGQEGQNACYTIAIISRAHPRVRQRLQRKRETPDSDAKRDIVATESLRILTPRRVRRVYLTYYLCPTYTQTYRECGGWCAGAHTVARASSTLAFAIAL